MLLDTEELQRKLDYKLSEPQMVMDYYWSKFPYLAILSGKRVGKTGWVRYKAIEQSFNKEKRYWVIARTFSLSDRVWDGLTQFAKKLDFEIDKDRRRVINPLTGSMIEAYSTNNGYEHLRGESVDGVFVEEACLVQRDAYDNDIEPNLLTTAGFAVLISNAPASSANWFMQKWFKYKSIYKLYHGRDLTPEEEEKHKYAALHFTSYDSPFIPKHILDEKKAQLLSEGKKDVWERQYMAMPPNLKGEVFEYGLNDCLADDFFLPQPFEYGRFVGVLDPARKKDKPVLCIWDKKIKTAVKFYEFEKCPAPDLEEAVIKKLELWGCYKFIIDETGGGFYLLDHFKKTLREKITDKNKRIVCSGLSLAGGKKNMIIDALKSRIENWAIQIVRDPELLRQLEVFTKRELASGQITYSAPKGDYDDYVDALAIANWEDLNYPYTEQRIISSVNTKNKISIIHS